MPYRTGPNAEDIVAAHLSNEDVSAGLWERLDELEAKLMSQKSNPAVVGLAAFGVTTMLLQLSHFDLVDTTPAVWVGVFVGGLAQMIAGLQEYGSGDNLAYSTFTTYGGMWCALAVMILCHRIKFLEFTPNEFGAFLMVFDTYTFMAFVASWGTNVVLCLTFFALFVGMNLLGVAQLLWEHNGPITYAASVFLILSSLGAWYVMCHLIYKDTFGKDILPVGPAPWKVLTGEHNKMVKKRKASYVKRYGGAHV